MGKSFRIFHSKTEVERSWLDAEELVKLYDFHVVFLSFIFSALMTRDKSAMDSAESHEDPVVDNGAMWRLVGDKLSAKYRMDQKAQESAMMQLAHIPEPMTKISAFRLMLMLCDPLQFRVNLTVEFFNFFNNFFNFFKKHFWFFKKKKFVFFKKNF